MKTIESHNVCAVTEANDKSFPKVRLAVLSFLTYNQWFDGDIYILLTNKGISENFKNELCSISNNIKFISTNEADISKLRRFVFWINSPSIIYFSKDSIFQKDMSDGILEEGISSIEYNVTSVDYNREIKNTFDSSIMIISKNIDRDTIKKLLESENIQNVNISINAAVRSTSTKVYYNFIGFRSALIKNKNYPNFIRYSKSTSYISYENTNHSEYSRINLYWIALNKKLKNPPPSKISLPIKNPFIISPEVIKSSNTIKFKPKEFKFMVLVPVHERFQVLKLFALGIEALRKQGYNIDVLAVGSSNQDMENCETLNFKYINHRNILGEKLNVALKYSKQFDFDGMLMLGSDDVLNSDVLDFYVSEFNKGSRFVGFIDCYFYSLETSELLKWNGYNTPDRAGEPIGAWRCFKRDLIEDLGWTLWGNQRKSIDASMWAKIKNMKDITTAKLSNSMFICDLKTSENVTKFTKFKNSVVSNTDKIKLLKDRDIIEKIINY